MLLVKDLQYEVQTCLTQASLSAHREKSQRDSAKLLLAYPILLSLDTHMLGLRHLSRPPVHFRGLGAPWVAPGGGRGTYLLGRGISATR